MSGILCQSPDWRNCCEDCRHVTSAGACQWRRYGHLIEHNGMIVCAQCEAWTGAPDQGDA